MKNNRVIRFYEPSKYHNEKTEVDGIVFDSKKEANRYRVLKLLEKAGEITDLRRQVKYELIPAQYEMETRIRGNHVSTVERCVEKAVTYYADFVYKDVRTEETVVEDAKGVKTEAYKIKKKLMLWVHGIKIREV